MSRFVYDTYTAPVDEPLEDHVGEMGAAWTPHPLNAAQLQVNAIGGWLESVTGADGRSIYIASGVPVGDEVIISADVTRNQVGFQRDVGLVARLSETQETFYLARYWQSTRFWQLYVGDNGIFTFLGQWFSQLTDTRNLKLDVSNARKRLIVDDVVQVSSPDNSVTGTNRVGPRFTMFPPEPEDAIVMDNFQAFEPITPDDRTVSIGSENRVIAIGAP